VFFTTSDGVRLYYEDVGTGAPVVLLHGAAGSARAFDPLIARLSQSFRVVALDYRGLGRSARVTDLPPTAWCDDVVALLDHVEIDRAHLAGCSLGARIAGRVTLDNRARVLTLSVDAPLVAVGEAANSQLNDRFNDPDHATPEDLARWQRFHGEDWKGAVRFYGRVRNQPEMQRHLTLRPQLPSLDLPTLITRGDLDDDVHPLGHAVEWHRAHPDSWLWVAPGTGFSLMQRRPDEFAAVFGRFVQQFSAAQVS
jgi:pimeloyl-ACP methyl ester carboxylesterase